MDLIQAGNGGLVSALESLTGESGDNIRLRRYASKQMPLVGSHKTMRCRRLSCLHLTVAIRARLAAYTKSQQKL
jgi:hypothetical protein